MFIDDAASAAMSPAGRVFFPRRDLDRILWLYGRMVAAGELRDYAIDGLPDRALFSMYRRASEHPLYQVELRPALARRQGAYALVGAQGQVLKRGHDLSGVLSPLEQRLMKVVED